MSVFTKSNIILLLASLFIFAPFFGKSQSSIVKKEKFLELVANVEDYLNSCSDTPDDPECKKAMKKLEEEAADSECGTPCVVLVETIGSSGCEAGNCNPFSFLAFRHLPPILTIRTFDRQGRLNGRSGKGRYFKQNMMYYSKGYSSMNTVRMEVKIKGMPRVIFENPAVRTRRN